MLVDPLPQYPTPAGGEFGAPRGIIGGINYGTHNGLDKSAPAGTPVPAAGAGRVIHSAGAFTPCGHIGAGNHVHVEHAGGLETRYNHLLARYVVGGQMVTTATIVGSVGASGTATGNHLHFEVLEGGIKVDPRLHIGGASVMGGRPATARLVEGSDGSVFGRQPIGYDPGYSASNPGPRANDANGQPYYPHVHCEAGHLARPIGMGKPPLCFPAGQAPGADSALGAIPGDLLEVLSGPAVVLLLNVAILGGAVLLVYRGVTMALKG